jgi:hypothetical protein
VIAGKSVLEFRRDDTGQNKSSKCSGFVQSSDDRPKRRLFEVLKSQGMQENQQVVFLSDGGEDVRNLQFYLNPQAEHLLDWFHVTMWLTVLTQTAKGLPERIGEGEEQQLLRSEVLKALESIKWYCGMAMCFRLSNICSLWGWIWRAQHSRTRRRPRASCSKRSRNSARTSNAIAALFRITASATVTVRGSALVSWNRQSTKW